ncbi:MAG: MmgE/PrpD family protein [Clostridiales bacterium]|nr:MmgE/PrpD family protein [Clostridiales bacterium]
MNQLENLSTFIADARWEDFPQEVKEAARSCTLDTISQALGAANNPFFTNIMDTLLTYEGITDATTSSPVRAGIPVWGTAKQAPLRTAVLLNGMLSHSMELDDVHTGSKTHIGTVVIPAAWSLCQFLGKSGQDFLEAVVCGYETMSRIGMGLGVSAHRNKGWHVTGTAGTFGAAAACGKLLHFSAEQMTSAFGLAGTQSCSTWAFLTDGATNKILHPGRAAANGLDACLLVQGGMKGTRYILDAEDGGIFPMMSDHFDYSQVDRDLGKTWEILNVDKKPYPCCRSTHCAIDAALTLREQYHIDPEQIENVHIDTYLVGWKQCALSDGSRHPQIPTEAKFSTPYTTACAFLNGSVGLSDFEISRINTEQRQELTKKVTVEPMESFTARYPSHWGCNMTVTLANGQTFQQEIADASGSVSSPLTREQLLRKANSCCTELDSDLTSEIFSSITDLDHRNSLPSLAF